MLGNVLVSIGQKEEGAVLIEEARRGREELKGIPPDVDNHMASYDSLVPYWAW
jgi:hypothetical protein